MTPDFAAALAEELALVIGALVDSTSALSTGEAPEGRQWVATIQGDGTEPASCTVAIDDASATAATAVIMGLSGEVPEQSVADMLREVLAQATSSLSQKPLANGHALQVSALEVVAAYTPPEPSVAYTLSADKLSPPLVFVIGGAINLSVPATPGPAAGATPRAAAASADSAPADRIDVILDIELPLVVRFGRTELPLKTLARLAPGSLIELGRSADDPVEVLVSNRLVARGEVVIVGGNYGVRIIDVVSPRQRMSSMEA